MAIGGAATEINPRRAIPCIPNRQSAWLIHEHYQHVPSITPRCLLGLFVYDGLMNVEVKKITRLDITYGRLLSSSPYRFGSHKSSRPTDL
jgi:hypothetical protein